MGELILQQWLAPCHHYNGKIDASLNGVFCGRIISSIKQAIVENGSEKVGPLVKVRASGQIGCT